MTLRALISPDAYIEYRSWRLARYRRRQNRAARVLPSSPRTRFVLGALWFAVALGSFAMAGGLLQSWYTAALAIAGLAVGFRVRMRDIDVSRHPLVTCAPAELGNGIEPSPPALPAVNADPRLTAKHPYVPTAEERARYYELQQASFNAARDYAETRERVTQSQRQDRARPEEMSQLWVPRKPRK